MQGFNVFQMNKKSQLNKKKTTYKKSNVMEFIFPRPTFVTYIISAPFGFIIRCLKHCC